MVRGMTEPPAVLLLYRAILTLNALPDPDTRYFAVGSTWPLYARRYLDAYNPDDETEAAWRPTPHDVSAYLDVLAWARDLSKRGWQIMVLRARDYSLPLIADMLRSAIADIRNDHADAIHVITTAASRGPNMWWSPLDNPPRMGDVARRHHCARSAVVFSFEQ
jgi:hypothetical protein